MHAIQKQFTKPFPRSNFDTLLGEVRQMQNKAIWESGKTGE